MPLSAALVRLCSSKEVACHSVEGAVAKVLVEREGEGQPPLPAAQPHIPGEVRVRVIDRVLGKGVGFGLRSWCWPG